MLNNLKVQLLSNWGFTRIIRLGLGIVMLIQAAQMHNILFGLFGSFFVYQGLLNKGCGAGGCGVPPYTGTKGNNDAAGETSYEEIKSDNQK